MVHELAEWIGHWQVAKSALSKPRATLGTRVYQKKDKKSSFDDNFLYRPLPLMEV